MPKNPQKRKCAHPGCRAWARRGSEFCQAHQPRVGPEALAPDGATAGEGFYAQLFTPEELAALARTAADFSLLEEIGILKVLIRRVLARNGHSAETLKLVGRAVDQLARAWRVERAISGEAADGLASAMGKVLDELSAELGIKL